MLSAQDNHGNEGFSYALDNGAWFSFCRKLPFDQARFLAAYRKFGQGAQFMVLPDIVAGGDASLAFSLKWRNEIPHLCPQLLAVQDGMMPASVAELIGPGLGIFVGGSTEWKLKTLPIWSEIARDRNAYLHVGRVNSIKRIALCAAVNANSFDGSSVSRYAVNLPKLDNARRQPDLFQTLVSKPSSIISSLITTKSIECVANQYSAMMPSLHRGSQPR
jgi:hypothetical protein